jgi:hypothetical protein
MRRRVLCIRPVDPCTELQRANAASSILSFRFPLVCVLPDTFCELLVATRWRGGGPATTRFYSLLHRHGWRKLMPRYFTPSASSRRRISMDAVRAKLRRAMERNPKLIRSITSFPYIVISL